MRVFIIGLPKSGKTTVAKELSQSLENSLYISAFDWVQSTFREKDSDESDEDYRRALHNFVSERLKINSYLLVDNIYDIMDINVEKKSFIIDGISSPKDFVHLFDYNKDVVIFLNRTDGPDYIEGFDQLNVNVIRDYCLWLASRNLLAKNSWLEYNFPIPGDSEDHFTKQLGQKNTVTITRSINKTIEILKGEPWNST